MSISIKYRPDIDGLRALAVIFVILYHFKFEINNKVLFLGGYIGVDIFFVISGYLITLIILNSYKEESFLKNFYERRVRRIIPVFLAVVIFIIPLSLVFYLPDNLVNVSNSILASLFFFSNIYFFFKGTEYNNNDGIEAPLLHLWSLSVEEQFYIFFPIISFILLRYIKPYLLISLFFILFIGLAFNYFGIYFIESGNRHTWPSLNFYNLFSRSWELIAGAILAVIKTKSVKKIKFKYFPQLGLILFFFSIYIFDHDTFHPSLLTLLPVISTCCLIYSENKDNIVYKFLSSKYLVYTGLISYSLYLWHFPILVFAKLENFLYQSNFQKFILLSLIIFLSIISYNYIEKPFRNRNKICSKKLFSLIFLVYVCLFYFVFNVKDKDGYPNRFPPIFNFQTKTELKIREENLKNFYFYNNIQSNKKILMFGDSHIRALVPNFIDKLKENNFTLITSHKSSCPFFNNLVLIRSSSKIEGDCNREIQNKRLRLLRENPDSIVILGSRLPLIIEEEEIIEGNKIKSNYIVQSFNKNDKNDTLEDRQLLIKKSMLETASEILKLGNTLVLVYPIPEMEFNVPTKFVNKFKNKVDFVSGKFKNEIHNDEYLKIPFESYKKRTLKAFNFLDQIKGENIIRIYPHKLFCNNPIIQSCIAHNSKDIFYRDSHHPSEYGANLVNNLIIKKIKNKKK